MYFLPMDYSYSNAISSEDHAAIVDSPLFQNWIQGMNPDFLIAGVRFESADFVTRKGKRILLFLKLNAQVTDENGQRVPGITMLRGHAVAILVVLWCEGKPYLLLVDQPRFPLGERHSLEIVAGMLDWSADWRAVALAELHEEAGLEVKDAELIDLMKEFGGQTSGFAVSCGLLDERLYLAAVERTVTAAELARMDGRAQEYLDENEGIHTVVLPYEEAARRFTDGKCINALFLYERWLRKVGRSLP